jgi:uncharacterized membrane protein YeaQ/YmgE (transglycosylase-associated protein family)
MGVVGWIVFGLITGFIASKIVNDRGEGCFVNIALGIVGAVLGGAIFQFLGEPVFFRFSLWSMFVAVLGAVIVLYLWHAATGRRTLK